MIEYDVRVSKKYYKPDAYEYRKVIMITEFNKFICIDKIDGTYPTTLVDKGIHSVVNYDFSNLVEKIKSLFGNIEHSSIIDDIIEQIKIEFEES